MGNQSYSYMKQNNKKEKEQPKKKKVNLLGIIVTVFGVIDLIILILSILSKVSGGQIVFWSIATALCAGIAVILFACQDD